VEEPDDLARAGICSGDVRTFVPIAMKTGQGEILKNGRASVLACNDVVHRKGKG